MYTLDTNTIIYAVKAEDPVVGVIDEIINVNASLYVSAITETELFSYFDLTPAEAEKLNNFLKLVKTVNLDSELARYAGMVRRVYRLKLADSIIAATAMYTGTTLITRNIKDFKRIPDLLLKKI